MIDELTMKWIKKLTTNDQDWVIKTLTKTKTTYQDMDKEAYIGFCEGFLIPKRFLEPERDETMIQEIFAELRKRLPKGLLDF